MLYTFVAMRSSMTANCLAEAFVITKEPLSRCGLPLMKIKLSRAFSQNTIILIVALLVAQLSLGASAQAQSAPQQPQGTVTGLPIPRFVSLKSDRVNLREGPSKDNRTSWVFQRAGLPVEIVAEYETWRRIRDSEGAEGWVLHSLLSGRRTALIAPWTRTDKGQPKANASHAQTASTQSAETLTLHERADARSGIVARLQPGVLGNVKQCDGTWCRIQGSNGAFDGYIRQDRLWGVYPNERVE
jgi:SH3-like domain-containing protein